MPAVRSPTRRNTPPEFEAIRKSERPAPNSTTAVALASLERRFEVRDQLVDELVETTRAQNEEIYLLKRELRKQRQQSSRDDEDSEERYEIIRRMVVKLGDARDVELRREVAAEFDRREARSREEAAAAERLRVAQTGQKDRTQMIEKGANWLVTAVIGAILAWLASKGGQ